METTFDTIIIGLGAMGSAAAYQLAKRNVGVLGIDQYAPPHTLGSTHGETRITRQAIGEGEQYVPMAIRSHELWREIEAETGIELLTITGCALICGKNPVTSTNGIGNFFDSTLVAAQKFHLPHEVMNAQQFMKKFPQFRLEEDESVFFDQNGGFVRPERCIESQISLAKKYGANIHVNEKCLQYECSADGKKVTVMTDKGEYTASKLILSVGPWIQQLLPEFQQHFRIYRQALFWFSISGSVEPFLPQRFPVFMWQRNEELYGFPVLDVAQHAIKVASEEFLVTTTPDTVDRIVSQNEVRRIYQKYVEKQFPDISEQCIMTSVCLYTVTTDASFVIDTHPKHSQIIIASPCSGHGFKHSAAIGEILAELATEGKSTIDISAFSIDRLLTK